MHSSLRVVPRRALAATLTALAAAAVAALLPGAATADGTLTGTVGPGFTISLIDGAGKPVQHLDAGTYTITVHDRSELHNFHLFGAGGVSKFTDVEGKGDETWTVTLVDGKYSVMCDPHGAAMEQDFTVGAVAAEQTPATTTAAAPAATATAAKPAAKPAATTKAAVTTKAPALKQPPVKKPAPKKPAPKKTASK